MLYGAPGVFSYLGHSPVTGFPWSLTNCFAGLSLCFCCLAYLQACSYCTYLSTVLRRCCRRPSMAWPPVLGSWDEGAIPPVFYIFPTTFVSLIPRLSSGSFSFFVARFHPRGRRFARKNRSITNPRRLPREGTPSERTVHLWFCNCDCRKFCFSINLTR